jgi:flagellar basal body P-ring formation protein FlgA
MTGVKRMTPIFRRLALLSAAFAAPASGQGFEDLDQLEGQVVAMLGAGIGEAGGPARPLDRRLRLRPCPEPVTVDEPAMGAVAVRCQAVGWRIRVPLAGEPTAVRAAAVRRQPIIRRGDQVEVVAIASSFTVSTRGIAEQDGAEGDRIRVRTERRESPLIGQVLADGRIALPGFN